MEFSLGRSKMEKEWKKQECSSPTEMPLGDEGLEGKESGWGRVGEARSRIICIFSEILVGGWDEEIKSAKEPKYCSFLLYPHLLILHTSLHTHWCFLESMQFESQTLAVDQLQWESSRFLLQALQLWSWRQCLLAWFSDLYFSGISGKGGNILLVCLECSQRLMDTSFYVWHRVAY